MTAFTLIVKGAPEAALSETQRRGFLNARIATHDRSHPEAAVLFADGEMQTAVMWFLEQDGSLLYYKERR